MAQVSTPTATASSTELCDGWCGWCGAVFINQPANEAADCAQCGKSLAENPPEGPVAPQVRPPDGPFADALNVNL